MSDSIRNKDPVHRYYNSCSFHIDSFVIVSPPDLCPNKYCLPVKKKKLLDRFPILMYFITMKSQSLIGNFTYIFYHAPHFCWCTKWFVYCQYFRSSLCGQPDHFVYFPLICDKQKIEISAKCMRKVMLSLVILFSGSQFFSCNETKHNVATLEQ